MQPPFTIEDDETPLPPAPIDPALAESAIVRIRKQVQGNGLRPSSVELRGLSGHVHTFYGTTSVRFTPTTQTGKRAGRISDGQIIQAQQIDSAIADFIARMAADRGVLGMVHQTILSRPDQGFGISGETIPLPQVSRLFVAHDACPKCRGAGGTACHNCHGQQRVTCYRCHGQGGISCVTCQGRGQIITPQGPVTCNACYGRAMTVCPICQGQRLITCPECQGQGKKICETCKGLGWTTQSWNVTLSANTTFHLRTSRLPPALVGVIERVGPARMAADRHANITPILDREAENHKNEADIEPDASLWFLYRAEMPFAELDIAMGKGTIKPKLAGYKARLVDMPDFMDTLLKPGAQNLAGAAQGGAGAAQKILEASRYRALGDVLRGLARATPKRVLKSLIETYPLGLSESFAKRIVKDAGQAMSRVSLWPRSAAMVGSLIASFLVMAGFYLYGGRLSIAQQLDAIPWAIYIADALLFILLGLGGTYAIRAIARRSLRVVLEGLGVVSGGQLPLPRPGVPGLWLWLGLAGMMMALSIVSGIIG